MDKKFIDQVHHIVMSNITDEKFGVRKLASLLGLSASQTLRKVRTETGKSVNQYIRELRLKKASKLIKKTDLTISEIAFKVGFNSQPYFSKTFRNRYGITPGEYKTQNISSGELASKRAKNKAHTILNFKKAFFLVSAILLFAVGYFIVNKTSSKIKPRSNSIAVLPFRDMSPEDNQWFSDGVSDNILIYLSHIKDLTVISFTSTSNFRDTDKSIPEIAKELGVSYILEGSVTVFEDKVKINTQLINANDEHLWSEDYNENFENVITIQQNISEEIARELELTLSPKEEEALKKYPTDNLEAYRLFLKGRLINDSRTTESFVSSLEYNKQAVALDSNYAEAYAQLAYCYHALGTKDYFEWEFAIDKGIFYYEKALKIDPNCVMAITVKALITGFVDRDPDKAEKLYEKALALNPNNAISHYFYGLHYFYFPEDDPNLKKALYHMRNAQRLDPFSLAIAYYYFNALLFNDKIEEVVKYFNKISWIWGEEFKIIKKRDIEIYKYKDWREAIRFFKTEIEKDPENPFLFHMLGSSYDEILYDHLKAIEYLKKAYTLDSTNSEYAFSYYDILVESNQFKEARKLFESTNFKTLSSEKQQLIHLFDFYYYQENYKNAQEVLKDSLMADQYTSKMKVYAQLGDRAPIEKEFNRFTGDARGKGYKRQTKAVIYAILEEKDSMYLYLQRLSAKRIRNIKIFGRREFDPYRKEERFKDILKNLYLPINHGNE